MPARKKSVRKRVTKTTSAARPRPGKRATSKAMTRQRIVTAALQLFEARGFDATTTRQIARKARVAEGTIFNYFETKEDIALHFFELEVDHAIDAVRSSRTLRNAPLEERLFALVQKQIEYLAPYEHFIGASLVQALRPSSKLAFSMQALALRTRYLAFVQELIDESLAVGERNTFAWIAPQAFWIYYLGVLLYWLHDTSDDKQSTLAFLDRSLKLGVGMLRKGAIS